MARITPPRGTQAVIRAIRLLKAFSPEHPELTLSQLCNSISLTKTTTHRLLTALESEGLVARKVGCGTYRLGPAILALGSQAMLTSDLRALVRPTLEALAQQTGETTTLEVLVGHHVLVLDGVGGKHLIGASTEVGSRWPFHVTSAGKAIVAFTEEQTRASLLEEPLIRVTERSVVDASLLSRQLEEIREHGYAVASGELEGGFVTVSAPFRGPMGGVEAAITIGGPATRFNPRRVRSLGTHLVTVSQRLSHRHLHEGEGVVPA